MDLDRALPLTRLASRITSPGRRGRPERSGGRVRCSPLRTGHRPSPGSLALADLSPPGRGGAAPCVTSPGRRGRPERSGGRVRCGPLRTGHRPSPGSLALADLSPPGRGGAAAPCVTSPGRRGRPERSGGSGEVCALSGQGSPLTRLADARRPLPLGEVGRCHGGGGEDMGPKGGRPRIIRPRSPAGGCRPRRSSLSE